MLNFQDYDRLPIVHFGFWRETLQQWADQGHISQEDASGWTDGNAPERAINKQLGFDFNWHNTVGADFGLRPRFESKVLEELPDGSRKVLNHDGVIVLQNDDAGGIPAEIDHLLKASEQWQEFYLPRLQWSPQRAILSQDAHAKLYDTKRDYPLGLNCGSLLGRIRDWMGVTGLAYVQADEPLLFEEMIQTVADLCYRCTEAMLAMPDVTFDFGHFWEDICFKNGPLINPQVFKDKVAPGYRRISKLLSRHGIDLVSLDCDGKVDLLLPIWLEQGINIMFPMEVGTWDANIRPWREKYGRAIRGVGGMDKQVFAYDRAAIDSEIERLRPLIALGGYLPCPDHRIPPNAKWDNVQYYCEQMRKI
ncbi:MAG: hypothetical protein JKX85_07575 [Phycisphaeraceae bacterium]|nr:hypothetical protein [Phycisphaeraceae bacterium]